MIDPREEVRADTGKVTCEQRQGKDQESNMGPVGDTHVGTVRLGGKSRNLREGKVL